MPVWTWATLRAPLQWRLAPPGSGFKHKHGIGICVAGPEVGRQALRGPFVIIRPKIPDAWVSSHEVRQLVNDRVGALLDAHQHEAESNVDLVQAEPNHLTRHVVLPADHLA